jgi:[protein-PII] uridylyltransferase
MPNGVAGPAPSPQHSQQQIARWRQTLADGRASLRQAFHDKQSCRQLLRHHCALMDGLLESIWQELRFPPSMSLLAVGGYGRGELFPYSDIDLLILLQTEADESQRQSLEQLISLYWDIGLEVGHSVRTVDECVEEAQRDITVQTNLLEARLICGSRQKFEQFSKALSAQFDPQAFFEAKLLEQHQRHARFHDTAYNLEPNLKESPGGLRDLQNILWISRGAGIGQSWATLVRENLITRQEAQQIRRHEEHLYTLRVRLHYLAKRREDRLLFDFQSELAHQLGFSDRPPRRASELLMQRYYRTAKAVGLLNLILLQNLRTKLFPSVEIHQAVISERFTTRNRMLEAEGEDLFQRFPNAILECFLLLQRNPQIKGIGASTLRALWRSGDYIDAAFRHNPENRALFMQILREPHGITHALRSMHQIGILGHYIPAFGRIVGQMQHDLFHVYTVDEHILMVVRNLRRFTVVEFSHEYPLCSRLINDFERPEVLYLAALFHDIAKGRGGDHSKLGRADAARFCKMHGLTKEDIETVVWLVESHLTMSSTAQKQDLSDPECIASFARLVRDQRRLNALYLLTVADVRGTSPKVWNAWKGKLLEDLFRATQRYLMGTSAILESQLPARQIEALQILRLYALNEKAHEPLWSKLDESYFLRHEAQEIAWHTRLLQTHVETQTPIVRARLSPIGEGIQVMIYTPDQNDLFSRICSFFERINYNILAANIHTTLHGYALDSFLVMDEATRNVPYRDFLAYIEHELTERLTRRAPLEEPLQGRLSRHLKHFPLIPEVSIRPDERGIYQVLTITAGDRPGLLSRIAQTFLKHGVALHAAKITTLGERAEDTFLIKGEQLGDTKAVLRLETELLQQLKT